MEYLLIKSGTDSTRYAIDVNSVEKIIVNTNEKTVVFYLYNVDDTVKNLKFTCDNLNDVKDIIRKFKKLGGQCKVIYRKY